MYAETVAETTPDTQASPTPPAPRALRVCAVLPSATRGGAEIWMERLAAASSRLEVDVVTLAEGPAAQAWRERGARVTVIPTGGRAKGATGSVLRLARHLRAGRPDLVLGHGVKAGLIGALAGHLSATRAAWVRHDDSFGGRPVRLLDRLTDGSISAVERLTEDRGRPSVVAGPPPVQAALPREQARRELGLPAAGERLRVAMATRLVPYKGVDDAISALVAAPRWELHVYALPDAAHPEEADRLTRLAHERGVADRVHLHDPVEDIGARLTAFDAVAVLTRDDPGSAVSGEAYGVSAHEAMACGTSVVSTPPLDGHLGRAALPVRPGDPASLAEVLVRLEDPELRADLGSHGLAHEASVHQDSGTDALERHLAEVARRPGAGLAEQRPVSVITTVLDEAEGLDELLRALRPQLGDDDEIVVVDGGSRDGTLETGHRHAAQDPRVRIVETDGAGISQGRNIGIAQARHDLLACTDVGCDPDPGWLPALRAAGADRPQAGLLTGVYAVTSTSALQSALAVTGYPMVDELTHPSPLTRLHGRLFGRSFDATMPTGRSMAVTAEAWREAGGFPEHLATGEDVTFGRTVARTHDAHLVSDALVTWEQRPTLRSTLRMYYRYGLGSGHSGDRRLLARDGARALAYGAGGAMLLAGGPRLRGLAAAGATLYLWVPLRRAASRPHPMAVTALVPLVTVLRDGAKVAGAAVGLRQGAPERAGTTPTTTGGRPG